MGRYQRTACAGDLALHHEEPAKGLDYANRDQKFIPGLWRPGELGAVDCRQKAPFSFFLDGKNPCQLGDALHQQHLGESTARRDGHPGGRTGSGFQLDNPVKQQEGVTVGKVCRGISLNAKPLSFRGSLKTQVIQK